MLMWLTGFLVVPVVREWSGLPFLALGVLLLAFWLRAHSPDQQKPPGQRGLQQWVGWLAVEEAFVGAVTGPLAGVHQAWSYLGFHGPTWISWLSLLAGPVLLALALWETMPLEWLLPVHGRWRRMTLAASALACLHLAGPCWVFLIGLWRFEEFGAAGPQLLTARLASGLLATVVLLYTATFVLRLGRRAPDAEAEVSSSLSPQAS